MITDEQITAHAKLTGYDRMQAYYNLKAQRLLERNPARYARYVPGRHSRDDD